MPNAAFTIVCATIAGAFTFAGVGTFIQGTVTSVRVITTGSTESGRWTNIAKRIWLTTKIIVLHTTFKQRPLIRVAHWLVMMSFVVLLVTLMASYNQIFNPAFTLPLISQTCWGEWGLESFAWIGLLAILILTMVRSIVTKKTQDTPRSSRFHGSTQWQGYFVEWVIGTVCASVLAVHALQFALLSHQNSHHATANRGSYPLTAWVGTHFLGAPPQTLANWIVVVATIKICVSMLWMTAVGLNVTMGVSWHRFLAPVNIVAGRNADGSKPLGALSLPLVKGNPSAKLEEAAENDPDMTVGLGTTADLTWKDRLDVLTCTECGRCQNVCPAWNTGKPLSPKLLILALRDNVASAEKAKPVFQKSPNSKDILSALYSAKVTEKKGVASRNAELIPDVILPEALWDCTMCGACVEQCPVNIEHVDRIGNLRRHQFLMESQFPRELHRPMRSMETKRNPYNQSPKKRLDWTKNLGFDIPVIGEHVHDAQNLDYLFWVGCAGAYDQAAKKTSAAVAELLHIAGIKFGVLGSTEPCCGDPARRTGNEILFQTLANNAIETLRAAKVQKIVVTCAHCYNTLLNEFPQFGGTFDVLHHTQLLNTLVRDKRLHPIPPPENQRITVTYQDPCFLGRHNKIYKPPRELLQSIPNLESAEMVDNRSQAMCCGAGGAHAWMEETPGTRIADTRMAQAQNTGASVVATACPFCTQMLDTAPTVTTQNTQIQVKDVAVLLLEGVRRGQQENRPRQ